jgi:hypothetical protein
MPNPDLGAIALGRSDSVHRYRHYQENTARPRSQRWRLVFSCEARTFRFGWRDGDD